MILGQVHHAYNFTSPNKPIIFINNASTFHYGSDLDNQLIRLSSSTPSLSKILFYFLFFHYDNYLEFWLFGTLYEVHKRPFFRVHILMMFVQDQLGGKYSRKCARNMNEGIGLSKEVYVI